MDRPAPLLPFHEVILSQMHDPATSELLVLARGLGLRRILCTLLQIYDSPRSLIVLVGASAEEEAAIGEELGIMGCRRPGLRSVGYEMGKKDRQELYNKGGLVSVTSRILVVDMLQGDIPIDLITGLLVLHAERVTALSLEAFIVRLFREKNRTGFLKAFSDEPEHITSGMAPLRAIMKELQLRTVLLYPRFQEDIQRSLEKRKADVVELHQPMTELMTDIHQAIVQCMATTLAELKRSNTTLELDDLTVQNAYFRSFDAVVRRQLDPVWHRVGPRTKQLVGDLATLRRLLTYLLTYDPLAFHAYCETVISVNSSPSSTTGASTATSSGPRQHHSSWLLTDAAHVIFTSAKRRCYVLRAMPAVRRTPPHEGGDEDEWAALDEAEGRTYAAGGTGRAQAKERDEDDDVMPWLPRGIEPVLEELPKWSLLADVLVEIEEEIIRQESMTLRVREWNMPSSQIHFLTSFDLILRNHTSVLTPMLITAELGSTAPSVSLSPHPAPKGTNTVLIMTSSPRSVALITEFLSTMDASKPRGRQGRRMMGGRLAAYLWWRGQLGEEKEGERARSAGGAATGSGSGSGYVGGRDRAPDPDEGLSEALKKKDRERRERVASRRRVRGGAPVSTSASGDGAKRSSGRDGSQGVSMDAGASRSEAGLANLQEAEDIADFLASQSTSQLLPPSATSTAPVLDLDLDLDLVDTDYGLLPPSQTVVVRAYSDDSDDRLLLELRPRFVVLFEPHRDFVRRVEVFRSLSPGMGVRVYFMLYKTSCEEEKYLAGLRREKDAFEKLIKERGSMLLPLEETVHTPGDNVIKTISSRIAGGRRELNKEPSRVIVDMREFRSTLPSLLHASKLQVVPATLTVGDYILTPDICVERKSIPDLVSSFNSGRLYTQCELMSVHYKQPILLIEFEEHKSFSLETVADVKSFAKSTNKYPAKKSGAGVSADGSSPAGPTVQSKLVLLALTFPRVRIIWSSSPYATAEIVSDLKLNNPEPDPGRAVAIGAEEDPEAGAGVNQAAEELLRALPGVTAKNVKYVMSRVGSVRELCEMPLARVQEILGVEPGKTCHEFMHRGDRKR